MGELPLRRVANVAGMAVLALGVLLAVVLVAPGAVGAEGSFVVRSDSMAPAIDAGDVVVVSPTDGEGLDPGTVITFRRADGTLVTHRIVAVEQRSEGTRYTTKGDANEEPDEQPVAPSQVVGTLWVTIPLVGHLVAFANTDLGLLVLVVVPGLLLLVSEVWDIYTAPAEQTEGGAPRDR
jgi:signal peptidase